MIIYMNLGNSVLSVHFRLKLWIMNIGNSVLSVHSRRPKWKNRFHLSQKNLKGFHFGDETLPCPLDQAHLPQAFRLTWEI